MKIVGLTGGIGSGKSTVAQFLTELGAAVIDADKVGHEAIQPGTPVFQKIVAAFGQQIIGASGEIDRARLGEIVFKNPQARERLNEIIHPIMYDMVMARLDDYQKQGVKVVVLDAPLLLDAGWASLVDEVWVTITTENTILERLSERSDLSAEEIKARIRSQLPSEERIKHADVVIDTACTLDELKAKAKEMWQRLQG
ncbi:dephospho-CoA kinase [Chloroflexota bacterium]